MQKNYPDKSISNKDIEEPTPQLVEFNFPQHGITVKAKDLDEAKAKLKQLINK